MPLSPGERYLPEEVEIMQRLKYDRHQLETWERHRKNDTNSCAIVAAGNLTVYKFNEKPLPNTLETIEGEIKLSDVGCLDRALRTEKNGMSVSMGALRYGLHYLADTQKIRSTSQTSIFNLNTCGIDKKTAVDDFEMVHSEFDELIKRYKPYDPFKTQHIIVPVFFKGEGFVTVISNPYALVKPEWDKSNRGKCVMRHIGPGATTTEYKVDGLPLYRKYVVPKIKLIFRKLFITYAAQEEYTGYRDYNIKEEEVILPNLESHECGFQLLWIMKRLMRGPLEDIKTLLAHMQKTSVETTLEEMEKIRQHLWLTLGWGIERVGDKAVAHILKHRTRCIVYEEQNPLDEMDPQERKEMLETGLRLLDEMRARKAGEARDAARLAKNKEASLPCCSDSQNSDSD